MFKKRKAEKKFELRVCAECVHCDMKAMGSPDCSRPNVIDPVAGTPLKMVAYRERHGFYDKDAALFNAKYEPCGPEAKFFATNEMIEKVLDRKAMEGFETYLVSGGPEVRVG